MAHPVHVTTADPFRHAPASAEHALFTAVAAGDANAVVAVLSKLESSLSLSSVANCLGRRGQFVREAHDGRLVKHGTAASPFFSSSSPPQREHEPPHNINDGGGGDGGDVDDDGGAELVSPLGLSLLLAAQSPDPSASLSADDSVFSVLVRHGARLSGGFGAGGATEALTPLHRAVLSGEEALVWWVLGTAGAFSPLSRRASGLNCVGATAGASASAGNNPCTPNSNNAATNTAINTETAATSSCSAAAASSLGFDINAPTRDDEGLTALHLAAMGAGVACEEACADEEECAALGLSPLPTAVGSGGGSPAVDPTDAADSALNTRQSPSPQCIYRRRLAIVRLLLMGGADPNAVDAAGQTPLFAAAQYGDEGTLEALIHWEGSAAADAADDDAKSAVASQHRFANTNPLTNRHSRAGHAAALDATHCFASSALSSRVDVPAKKEKTTSTNENGSSSSAKGGHCAHVDAAREVSLCPPRRTLLFPVDDEAGRTPFHVAAACNQPLIMRSLLHLLAAEHAALLKRAEAALQQQTYGEANAPSATSASSLLVNAASSSLCFLAGPACGGANDDGNGGMKGGGGDGSRASVFAPPSMTDVWREAVEHTDAPRRGCGPPLHRLLAESQRYKSYPNGGTYGGDTASALASLGDSASSSGGGVFSLYCGPSRRPAATTDEADAPPPRDHAPPSSSLTSSWGGMRAIHFAAAHGALAALEFLVLEAGADTNAKTARDGWTALHYAVSEGHHRCAVFLLQCGRPVIVRKYLCFAAYEVRRANDAFCAADGGDGEGGTLLLPAVAEGAVGGDAAAVNNPIANGPLCSAAEAGNGTPKRKGESGSRSSSVAEEELPGEEQAAEYRRARRGTASEKRYNGARIGSGIEGIGASLLELLCESAGKYISLPPNPPKSPAAHEKAIPIAVTTVGEAEDSLARLLSTASAAADQSRVARSLRQPATAKEAAAASDEDEDEPEAWEVASEGYESDACADCGVVCVVAQPNTAGGERSVVTQHNSEQLHEALRRRRLFVTVPVHPSLGRLCGAAGGGYSALLACANAFLMGNGDAKGDPSAASTPSIRTGGRRQLTHDDMNSGGAEASLGLDLIITAAARRAAAGIARPLFSQHINTASAAVDKNGVCEDKYNTEEGMRARLVDSPTAMGADFPSPYRTNANKSKKGGSSSAGHSATEFSLSASAALSGSAAHAGGPAAVGATVALTDLLALTANGSTALHFAILRSRVDLADAIVGALISREEGEDTIESDPSSRVADCNSGSEAQQCRKKRQLTGAICRLRCALNKRDCAGYTPLHLAVIQADVAAVSFLLGITDGAVAAALAARRVEAKRAAADEEAAAKKESVKGAATPRRSSGGFGGGANGGGSISFSQGALRSISEAFAVRANWSDPITHHNLSISAAGGRGLLSTTSSDANDGAKDFPNNSTPPSPAPSPTPSTYLLNSPQRRLADVSRRDTKGRTPLDVALELLEADFDYIPAATAPPSTSEAAAEMAEGAQGYEECPSAGNAGDTAAIAIPSSTDVASPTPLIDTALPSAPQPADPSTVTTASLSALQWGASLFGFFSASTAPATADPVAAAAGSPTVAARGGAASSSAVPLHFDPQTGLLLPTGTSHHTSTFGPPPQQRPPHQRLATLAYAYGDDESLSHPHPHPHPRPHSGGEGMLLVAGSPDASITTTNNAALLRGDGSQMHAAVQLWGREAPRKCAPLATAFLLKWGRWKARRIHVRVTQVAARRLQTTAEIVATARPSAK